MTYTKEERVELRKAIKALIVEINNRKQYLNDHELTLNTHKQVKDLTELKNWINYIFEGDM